jgi:sortase A
VRSRSLSLADVVAGLLIAPMLVGCVGFTESRRPAGEPASGVGSAQSVTPSPTKPDRPRGAATPGKELVATPSPSAQREPGRSFLSIPKLEVRDLTVVRYRGSPDDGPGTRIQNRGPAASPRGPDGGVGPGEVGNFIITGHRLSGAAPFRYLPRLRVGDRALVRSGGTVFVYEITDTRRTSFRSARSLAEQSAAVPGRPGQEPVEAIITLSTCATIEDHAAGNFWADRFGNPEHRIDKIGVLVAARPA